MITDCPTREKLGWLEQSRALTGTAIYFEEIRAMSRIATLLGKREDAARYPRLN